MRPLLLCLSLGCLLACGGGSSSAPTPLAKPVISAFTATPSVITTGQNSRLAWTVTGANSLRLNDQTITGQGTTVSPAATTTYTLKATNAAGSSTASVTVSVGSQGVTYGDMRGADLGIGANLNGAVPFPADNAWNTDISAAPVDPDSDALIASIGAGTGLHPDFGSGPWDGANIGIPYVVVDSSQAKLPITFTAWPDESDPGPYPVPLNAPIEGKKLDGSTFGGDRHVLVIDKDANKLYELGNAFPQSDRWDANCGAVFDLTSNALRPAGWTSADAAGLPIFPGLARYEEAASGVIRHALRFTVDTSRQAYVLPATHWASDDTSPNLPPMGMRVRLKASYSIPTSFSAETQVILHTLKTYGMIVADNGSSWFISGAPDERWNNDSLVNELSQVKGSDFEVVRMDGIVTP